jgi:hypothetical protein
MSVEQSQGGQGSQGNVATEKTKKMFIQIVLVSIEPGTFEYYTSHLTTLAA